MDDLFLGIIALSTATIAVVSVLKYKKCTNKQQACNCDSTCSCGCQEGEECTCNEVPAPTCDCPPSCTCGCQEGKPCTCNDN